MQFLGKFLSKKVSSFTQMFSICLSQDLLLGVFVEFFQFLWVTGCIITYFRPPLFLKGGGGGLIASLGGGNLKN